MPDDPNDVIIPASFCYETYKTQIIDLYRGLKNQYLFTDQDGMDILHVKYHKHIAELTDDLLSAASSTSSMGVGSKTRNKGAKKMQLQQQQQQQQQPVLSAVRLIEVEHHHNYEHFFSTVVEVLDRVDNKVRLQHR